MRMSVIGCGYLGAVHAAAMASIGHDVVGIDVDAQKVAALASGSSRRFQPWMKSDPRSPAVASAPGTEGCSR